jgi:Domain of unknown function (DUF2383)
MSSEYIEEFNSYLAGEISAVETFNLALQKAADAQIVQTLQDGKLSHSLRVVELERCVQQLGGRPSESSGIWGPFAKFSQNTAMTERDALAMLEQSEAERLVNYELQRGLVEGPVLEMLEGELLPAQHKTHLALSALLKLLDPIPGSTTH